MYKWLHWCYIDECLLRWLKDDPGSLGLEPAHSSSHGWVSTTGLWKQKGAFWGEINCIIPQNCTTRYSHFPIYIPQITRDHPVNTVKLRYGMLSNTLTQNFQCGYSCWIATIIWLKIKVTTWKQTSWLYPPGNGKDYSGTKFFYTEPSFLNKAHSTKWKALNNKTLYLYNHSRITTWTYNLV